MGKVSSKQEQPVSCIHQLIEQHAVTSAHNIALSYKDEYLSYGRLNSLSNQLAHKLIDLGVQPGDLVGVLLDRSPFIVICLLAILKAGAAYVPIDIEYPLERINYMIQESQLAVLITQQLLIENLTFSGQHLFIDELNVNNQSYHNPNLIPDSNALAYVLFTSGSTGTPKGVMVSHASLMNAFCSWQSIYQLNEEHCHLQMANFSFDVFTGDLVRALCFGGKLVLCPRNILLHPSALYELMKREGVNSAEFVPTIVRRLMEYLEHENLDLNFMKLIIVGSDNWSIAEYCRLQALTHSQARVISSYGLTEATIDSTYFENKNAQYEYQNDHSVPIGIPFPNTNIYILNNELERLTSFNESGEIYIGGKGVALGYLNKPELTKEKFIICPWQKESIERLYKTGDLGRILPNGNIEFLGRIDNQIKLRGMRIELSDIENVLNCHDAIRESLVVLARDETKHKRLVAYYVLESDCAVNIADLRLFLKNKLPSYMVPTVFISLDALPLTPNGKLDRAYLAANVINNDNAVKPRNKLEKRLATIWATVLHLPEVGIYDHFDHLGGDSLSLARILHEVEKTFQINIIRCEVEKNMTIEGLAKIVRFSKKSNHRLLS